MHQWILNCNPQAMNLTLVNSPYLLNDQDKLAFGTSASTIIYHILAQSEGSMIIYHIVFHLIYHRCTVLYYTFAILPYCINILPVTFLIRCSNIFFTYCTIISFHYIYYVYSILLLHCIVLSYALLVTDRYNMLLILLSLCLWCLLLFIVSMFNGTKWAMG